MHKVILFFTCCVLHLTLLASSKIISFRSGVTLNTFHIKDQAVSSLPHSNTLPGFYFAFQLHSDKSFECISISRFSGKIYNDRSIVNTKMSFAAVNWLKTWNISQLFEMPLGVGFSLNTFNTYTTRNKFPNNKSYYTFSTSLSPAFRFEKKLTGRKDRPIDLSFSGSAVIFSYIIRPSLWTISPISASGELSQDDNNYYTSGRFVSVNKLQSYSTAVTADFHPLKWFLISLGYNWNFFHYRADPAYYEFNHQFFLHVGIQL